MLNIEDFNGFNYNFGNNHYFIVINDQYGGNMNNNREVKKILIGKNNYTVYEEVYCDNKKEKQIINEISNKFPFIIHVLKEQKSKE